MSEDYSNLLLIVAAVSIITLYIFQSKDTLEIDNYDQRIENFIPYKIGSKSGFGFQERPVAYPLFLNFYPTELGMDPDLSETIRKLRFLVSGNPTITNGNKMGQFYGQGLGQTNMSSAKCPIILVPSIGASQILAKWSLRNTQNVKKLDAYGNFNVTEKWSCRDTQPNYVPIWFPNETSGLNQMCWSDNTRVHYNGQAVVNTDGLTSTVSEGPTQNYETSAYNVLLKAFNAMSYVAGSSLFETAYDFRTICSADKLAEFSLYMTNLIENAVSLNKRRAILVCHGLGCVLMNFLLTNASQEWKDTYIECFVMFSASFGGAPKALRVLLSGEDLPSKQEQKIIRDTSANFTGLHWMLPRPEIYGFQNIVNYRQVNYMASDIPKLINQGLGQETADIYTNIVNPINSKSLEAPGTTVYVLAGINVPTESSYVYSDLSVDPVKNYPFYKSDQPNQQQPTYNDNYSGDGTMPRAALEYPLRWSKMQKEPIHFRFYDGFEHTMILSKSESVKDLLEVIKQLNQKF